METILLNGPNCRTPIRAKRFGRISATRHRIKLAPLSLRISLEYMLKNEIRMTYKWIFWNENQLVGEGRIKYWLLTKRNNAIAENLISRQY